MILRENRETIIVTFFVVRPFREVLSHQGKHTLFFIKPEIDK